MAKQPDPKDLDRDGTVEKWERKEYDRRKEENPDYKGGSDTLTAAALTEAAGFAKDVIWSNKELRQLYKQAFQEEWTVSEFQRKLYDSTWWETNADFARKAWAAEQMGGDDWKEQLREGKAAVSQWAQSQGLTLTEEQLNKYGRMYWFQGWNDPDRAQFMAQELVEAGTFDTAEPGGDFLQGGAGNLQERLMVVAERNGLSLSRDYFDSAARSVATGLTTAEDWERQVREQAASLWPTWKDQIMGGTDARTLADGYLNVMANTFDVPVDSIRLDDPYISQAMLNTGPDGQAMGLFDFKMKLRQDPRWMGTKEAEDKVANIGNDILRMFGFAG